MSLRQRCEIPECTERAIVCLYAQNKGTPARDTQRGADPFYPVSQAHISYNLCVSCFEDMTTQMREAGYVNIRATGFHRRATG